MAIVSDKKIKQQGLTIIEMVISMSVFLIAVAAIFGVMRIATIQRNTTSNRTDQLRSARISVDFMRRDAINAGFGYHRTGGNVPDNIPNRLFGIPADADSERDIMTSIVAGDNVTTNSLNPDPNAKMDIVAFFSRDPYFNPPAPSASPSPGSAAPVYTDDTPENGRLIKYLKAKNTDSTVYVETEDGEAKNCKVNDIYLLEASSGLTQVLAMATAVTDNNKISFAINDPLNLNQSATATGVNKSLLMSETGGGIIKKVNIISYSVTNDGVLVRKRYGNQTGSTQVEQRELVFGVSDFQVKYLMEDGTTVDNPSSNHSGTINQQKMNNVVQIQINITIVPNFNGAQDVVGKPVTIKEFISTKNLRYEEL